MMKKKRKNCGKYGHFAKDYRKPKRQSQSDNNAEEHVYDTTLHASHDEDSWLIDNGATRHDWTKGIVFKFQGIKW